MCAVVVPLVITIKQISKSTHVRKRRILSDYDDDDNDDNADDAADRAKGMDGWRAAGQRSHNRFNFQVFSGLYMADYALVPFHYISDAAAALFY